jgi:hypothetical protein
MKFMKIRFFEASSNITDPGFYFRKKHAKSGKNDTENTKDFEYFDHSNALSNQSLLFEIQVKIVDKIIMYNFKLLT